jgi:hypothetical protein
MMSFWVLNQLCLKCLVFFVQPLDMGEATSSAGATRGAARSTAASSRRRRQTAVAPERSANDQRVFTYMRNKVIELEAQLKRSQLDLERVKSQYGTGFSPREEFLMGEIDLISQQFQGMVSFLAVFVQVDTIEFLLLTQTSALTGAQSLLEWMSV